MLWDRVEWKQRWSFGFRDDGGVEEGSARCIARVRVRRVTRGV